MRQTRMAKAGLVVATCFFVIIASRLLFSSSDEILDPAALLDIHRDVLEQVAESNNRFGCTLLNRLIASYGTKNNVIASPVSISVAMGMMLAGARESTAEEIRSVLQLPLVSSKAKSHESGVLLGTLAASFNRPEQPVLKEHHHEGDPLSLSVANSIWASNNAQITSEFLRTLKEHFASELYRVNFRNAESAADAINKWVEDKTKGKIPTIVSPNAIEGSQLVLVNAIYFKGSWAKAFQKENTKQGIFKLAEGEKKVDYMRNTEPYHYYKNEKLQAIELPYFGNEAAMMLVLPALGNDIKWSESLFSEIRKGAQRRRVSLSVPKFEFTSSFELSSELKALGIKKAFSGADFSGITHPSVPVSGILHKAFISVDEKGTEAAAATAIVFRSTAFLGHEEHVIELTFDRPFLFAIYQRDSGAILFSGKVISPSDSKL